MADEKKFHCEVLTPQGKAVGLDVISAVVPLVDGLMGFLAGRAPLIAMVGAGPLRLHESEKAASEYFVAGGFVHMAHNRLSILAEECQLTSSMDPAKANELFEQAKSLASESLSQRQRRREALAVAAARLKAAQSNW